MATTPWQPATLSAAAAALGAEPRALGDALLALALERTGLEHRWEVQLLVTAHQYYRRARCFDGDDVLLEVAAQRGQVRQLGVFGLGFELGS
jgi:hypothetical protein